MYEVSVAAETIAGVGPYTIHSTLKTEESGMHVYAIIMYINNFVHW